MKCPKCGIIFDKSSGRCYGCGYPKICDWCKKPIKNNKEYFSFHGKPPYPFNRKLTIEELQSNKSLWYICKKCSKRIMSLYVDRGK